MTVIELPDDQAAALTAKAAAQGLTLAQWMQKLAIADTEQAAGKNDKPAQLPVRHLGAMGSLHRRDIYDDAR
jgi:hypothetical protein